jgi:hypothetical protein
MGATVSKSKSITDIIQEATSEVMQESAANCSASSTARQLIDIENLSVGKNCSINISDISQTAVAKVNFNCLQDQKNITKTQTDFDSKIKEKLEAESKGGIGVSAAIVEAKKKLTQLTASRVKMSDIANCMSKLSQDQELKIKKLMTGDCEPGSTAINISNIAQKIFADNTTKCVQEQLGKLGTEVTAALSSDTIVSAVASGMDFSGLFMWLLPICFIIFIALRFFRIL